MPHLKSHNQNLENHIRKLMNDGESPYKSDNNLEIKILNQLIMDKDNKLAQVQRKIVSQE